MAVIDVTGPRSLHPFPPERDQPDAVRVRVRLLRPPRRGALRPQRRRGPRAHGRAAGRAGADPAGPGDAAAADDGHAGAGERRARPRRASPGSAASPTATGWSRTATSAGRSSPPARSCAAAACASSSTRSGEHRRQAPRGGRRLHRAGHDHAGRRGHAARVGRGRGPPADHVAAVPLALLLRHGHRRPRQALAANLTAEEIRNYLGADSLAYLTLDRFSSPRARRAPASAPPASRVTIPSGCRSS